MKNSIFTSVFMLIIAMFGCNITASAQNPGSVDQTFSAAGPGDIEYILPLTGGKYMVSNIFSNVLMRLNSDGSQDMTFPTVNRGNVKGMSVLDDGTIVCKVFGSPDFPATNGNGIYFLSPTNTVLGQLEIQNGSSSEVIVIDSNQFTNSTQPTDYVMYANSSEVWLIDADSTNGFQQQGATPYITVPGGIHTIKVINGHLYVGTHKGLYRYTLQFPIAGVNASDISFNNAVAATLDTTAVWCEIKTVAEQSNGVLIGGQFTLAGAPFPINLAKLYFNGNLDNSFSTTTILANHYIYSILVDNNTDELVVAGNSGALKFLNADGTSNSVLNTNLGTIDPGTQFRCLNYQSDGKILVSGYSLNSINGNSCNGIARLYGNENLNLGICLASIDSVGHSQIVFEKASSTAISYYKIYKFQVPSNWNAIDSLPYSNLSVYIDQNSSQSNAEKYKISVVDSNLNEGPLSESVTTLFLQNSVGLSGENNLTFSSGEGFEILYYRIIRLDANFNDLVLDSLPFDSIASSYSYTDWFVPPGISTYVVEAVSSAACSPSLADGSSVAQKTSSIYNSSRSNPIHVVSTGINNIQNSIADVTAFPNPTNGYLTINYNLLTSSDVKLTVCNITGAILKTFTHIQELSGQKSVNVNISDLRPGFYFLKVSTPNGEKTLKIAKN